MSEQNKPVRGRREQVECACQQIVQSSGWANVENWMRGHILEAEARGAAGQRRKDAVERKWSCNVAGETFVTVDLAVAKEWEQDGFFVTEHSPVNVAALEDRIAELEKENARLKTAQFYGFDEAEGVSDDISSFFDDHEPGTILEIDGYRCVNTKWALWDGNSCRSFDTEDEAAAALKREGGV